jgi:hypothetical protein
MYGKGGVMKNMAEKTNAGQLADIANFVGAPVALNRDGSLHSFTSRPKCLPDEGIWSNGAECALIIFPLCDKLGNVLDDYEYPAIEFSGDWKDSLTLPHKWME